MSKEENMLGDLTTLRERLGGRRKGKLLIGKRYAGAVKVAAGFKGRRFFPVDKVIEWLAANPDFRVTSVYADQRHVRSRKGRLVANGSKSNA